MPPGKLASQAGHAFLEAVLAAEPWRQAQYRADGLGTKICLWADDLAQLDAACAVAQALGVPHARIEDTGRNTTFGGVPTVSAAGFGPLTRAEARALLGHFRLFP